MGRVSKDFSKPKCKTSAYAFFMQATREQQKKNPVESLSFLEFSKQASEKWKNLSDEDRKIYKEMASKDSVRHQEEMANYVPTDADKKRKRKTKDPNAPKKALSAFFCFSSEERPKVKTEFPAMPFREVAKELGRWLVCENKEKYQNLAAKDKERYERERELYYGGSAASASAAASNGGPAASKKPAKHKEQQPAKN